MNNVKNNVKQIFFVFIRMLTIVLGVREPINHINGFKLILAPQQK